MMVYKTKNVQNNFSITSLQTILPIKFIPLTFREQSKMHHHLGARYQERLTKIATGARYLAKHSTSVSVLSFNPNNKYEGKKAQNWLDGESMDKSNVISHDVVSSTISTNPNTQISTSELTKYLLKYNDRITCMVYSLRERTADIFRKLIEKTGIFIIQAVKNLSPKRDGRVKSRASEAAPVLYC